MKIEADSTLVMIGDSITDCGREYPIGRWPNGLGVGYVPMIAKILGAACPQQPVDVINTGISGNTVRNLDERWDTDVLELKPDWLSVMIGINDVWRQFDAPDNPESHVYLPDYEALLDGLLAKENARHQQATSKLAEQRDAENFKRIADKPEPALNRLDTRNRTNESQAGADERPAESKRTGESESQGNSKHPTPAERPVSPEKIDP